MPLIRIILKSRKAIRYRAGRVGVHDRQALVLVNFGGATGEEIMELAREVQRRAYDAFGIAIEPEVNIL